MSDMSEEQSNDECWLGESIITNLNGVTCEDAQLVAKTLEPFGKVASPGEVPGLGTWEVFETDSGLSTYTRTDEEAGFTLTVLPEDSMPEDDSTEDS